MNIGISTACFYNMQPENIIPILGDAGFKYIEIFLNTSFEYKKEFCDILNEKTKEYGIKVVSVHGFVAQYEHFLFSSYLRRQNDALKEFESVAKAAKYLGADSYTFHGFKADGVKDNFSYKRFAGIMDNLSEIARSEGVFLAWENVSRYVSNDPNFIAKVTEFMNSDNLRFTLDLKQAIRSHKDYKDYIKLFGNKLINVHINDADKKRDCLLPGQGETDFYEVLDELRKINYDRNLIIEVYRSDFKDINDGEIFDTASIFANLVYEQSDWEDIGEYRFYLYDEIKTGD